MIVTAADEGPVRYTDTALAEIDQLCSYIEKDCSGNSHVCRTILAPFNSSGEVLADRLSWTMNRAQIMARLKAVEPQLRARGVAALYLFGSYARDEAGADSDVDVFIDPADEVSFGLIPLFDSRSVVAEALPGMDIAYSARRSIVPCYLPSVERDAIRVF